MTTKNKSTGPPYVLSERFRSSDRTRRFHARLEMSLNCNGAVKDDKTTRRSEARNRRTEEIKDEPHVAARQRSNLKRPNGVEAHKI